MSLCTVILLLQVMNFITDTEEGYTYYIKSNDGNYQYVTDDRLLCFVGKRLTTEAYIYRCR